ncbi:hypothetical protein DOT_3244 [Desulfosporosinus sp. OT]|nr:hypothetical protein DOT_3244 [Desulfosporosinus sp. OT]
MRIPLIKKGLQICSKFAAEMLKESKVIVFASNSGQELHLLLIYAIYREVRK